MLLQETDTPGFKVPDAVHQMPEGTATLTQILPLLLGRSLPRTIVKEELQTGSAKTCLSFRSYFMLDAWL